MLLIHARAGASPIHGIGLIAREFIPAGTKVWEFRAGFDLPLSVAEVEALSITARTQVLNYGWFDADLQRIMLSGDDDRFTNHSETPNTHLESGGCTFAVCDIHPGEEITFDYRQFGGTDFTGWDLKP